MSALLPALPAPATSSCTWAAACRPRVRAWTACAPPPQPSMLRASATARFVSAYQLCVFGFFPNPRPLHRHHHHHPLLVTLFTAQYDYGMKLAMSFVSMCETGVSAESIVTAIHAVCPTKMF